MPFLKNSLNQITVLFKNGDDLRQDNLVLQLMKIMDRLWMQNGLNMEMVLYNVIETGHMVGYIEFVNSSVTLSEIH